MKKVKKETAPRRDRRKERTEYLQSLCDHLNKQVTEAQEQAEQRKASATAACVILMAERAQLLARVQQLDVLLLTLGVRESNQSSPACETYPTATDLFGRRF